MQGGFLQPPCILLEVFMPPLISVITPVHKAHLSLLPVAMASVVYQTFQDWEAIIINDAGEPIKPFKDKRIRIIDSPTKQGNRAAISRNYGIAHAQGTFVIFLDADDYLTTRAMEAFIYGHTRHKQAYSYSGHYMLNFETKEAMHSRPMDYDQKFYSEFNLHPVTGFVPTEIAREVGGFHEDAPGWEDWTFWLRLAIHGYCGHYVRGPVFVYNQVSGVNHFDDVNRGNELMEKVRDLFRNSKGEIEMAGCGCGGAASAAKTALNVYAQNITDLSAKDGTIAMEYIGGNFGAVAFRSPISGITYRGGRNPAVRFISAKPEDIDWLLSLDVWQRILPVVEYTPPPAPLAQEV
jgi:glycosyltransferase involved in cell wall biosynthesis